MIPTVAFGSADHHIHYYDIRNIRDDGLFVFKGHAKAVSYVKFLNADELVSASTDSTLKQWCTKDLQCKRTYTGHTNEKNFVGLSTSNDFIACGSENNAVYCYYKSLSKPVICHKFTKERTTDADDAEDTANFVSSVCWKKNSNVLLAANSLGTISVRVGLALMLRACSPLSLLRSLLLFARCCCILVDAHDGLRMQYADALPSLAFVCTESNVSLEPAPGRRWCTGARASFKVLTATYHNSGVLDMCSCAI